MRTHFTISDQVLSGLVFLLRVEATEGCQRMGIHVYPGQKFRVPSTHESLLPRCFTTSLTEADQTPPAAQPPRPEILGFP